MGQRRNPEVLSKGFRPVRRQRLEPLSVPPQKSHDAISCGSTRLLASSVLDYVLDHLFELPVSWVLGPLLIEYLILNQMLIGL